MASILNYKNAHWSIFVTIKKREYKNVQNRELFIIVIPYSTMESMRNFFLRIFKEGIGTKMGE